MLPSQAAAAAASRQGVAQPPESATLPEHRLEGTNVEYALSLLSLARELGLPGEYVEQIRARAT